MSSELSLIFLAFSFVGLFLFWLFYRQSNSTRKLTAQYLIQQLKDSQLSDEKRSVYEKQLSNTLLSLLVFSFTTNWVIPVLRIMIQTRLNKKPIKQHKAKHHK